MTLDIRAVHFTSADHPPLQLEGLCHLPEGRGPFLGAIVAHPHPLYGGSMHSGIVSRIAQTLAERGGVALRFNFRGVEGSQGSYDQGRGETDDLIGALDWLAGQKEVDAGRLGVLGYSFGAWISGQAAARDPRVGAYVAVALPIAGQKGPDLSRFTRPKLFVTGDRDTISPPEPLREFVAWLPEPKTLHVIPGADHFLFGFEQQVADVVIDFVMTAL